jgi:hypothetical protein
MDSLTSFLQWGVPLWAVMGLCVALALVLWRVLRHTPKAKAAQSADAASSEIFELVKAGEWQVDFAVDKDCTLLSVGAAKIYGWPSQQLRFPFSRWRAHVVVDANGRGNPAELFQ